MNEIAVVYIQESTSWFESQPAYWRGRALTRKPQPGCDQLSKDYVHDMMLVGRYEDMAQQLEGKK